MPNMTYDIRTTEYAQQTLANLTGVQISVWEQYLGNKNKYEYTEDLVADVINSNGYLPNSYKDFEFIFFHVTTSANRCESFRKHGILDLKQTYSHHDSELRKFLQKHDIHIELDKQMLTYSGQRFDISYSSFPRQSTEAYKIGRKIYFDYAICGFLSIKESNSYGGRVHHCPEILRNIDTLLRLTLSQEWTSEHDSYEIVSKIRGENIYDGNENRSDKDKVLNYLFQAYNNAFDGPTEIVLQIKNHIQIPPSNILEIKPLSYWK